MVALLSRPNAADLAALADLMEDGRLTPEIEPPLPPAEVERRLGNGHRGGTLILIP